MSQFCKFMLLVTAAAWDVQTDLVHPVVAETFQGFSLGYLCAYVGGDMADRAVSSYRLGGFSAAREILAHSA